MTVQLVEVKKLLYEEDDQGERVLVRSTDSSKRAYLRFTNKTGRPVDIWWRDFSGTRHHYIGLDPGTFYDINSYISHPWEFTDCNTNERYVINNSPIYRAPPDLADMKFRSNWNITVGVRTLRQSAMLVLAENIYSPCCVYRLGLPKSLQTELQDLIMALHQPIYAGLPTDLNVQLVNI